MRIPRAPHGGFADHCGRNRGGDTRRSVAVVAVAILFILMTGDCLMSQIAPQPEQIQELLKGPSEGPVVMVNLLRYKKDATAPDEGISGQEAYNRYGLQMMPFVLSQGGRLIWSGTVDSFVIGDTEEHFDAIALVEYPSRREFLRITSDPKVREFSVHRTAGLEMQWLIATTTQQEGLGAGAAMTAGEANSHSKGVKH